MRDFEAVKKVEMKLAFIDDGICENTFSISQQFEHYQVTPDLCVKKINDQPMIGLSHGTMCAAIFHDIYPNNSNLITDIAILDDTGRAEISRLVASLEWCLANSIKLIHMSLGTLDYYDMTKLSRIIRALTDNQTILVAAFHNRYIKSYPAAFPGVFGVRRSKKKNNLKNGQIALDLCEGLRAENCFVANFYKTLHTHDGEKVMTNYSNSLAAPVLTGVIARYLNENQAAGFSDVFEHLINGCSKFHGHTAKIEPYVKKMKLNTHKPVVAFLSKDMELFFMVLKAFADLGFLTTAVSEEDCDTIPVHHYLNYNERISGSFLYTLECVYDPDIIVLCVNQSRLDDPINWDVIDVLIYRNGSYCIITTQDKSFQQNTVQDIVQCLCSYFQGIK